MDHPSPMPCPTGLGAKKECYQLQDNDHWANADRIVEPPSWLASLTLMSETFKVFQSLNVHGSPFAGDSCADSC